MSFTYGRLNTKYVAMGKMAEQGDLVAVREMDGSYSIAKCRTADTGNVSQADFKKLLQGSDIPVVVRSESLDNMIDPQENSLIDMIATQMQTIGDMVKALQDIEHISKNSAHTPSYAHVDIRQVIDGLRLKYEI